jgi:SAM-dependent methyltransferase
MAGKEQPSSVRTGDAEASSVRTGDAEASSGEERRKRRERDFHDGRYAADKDPRAVLGPLHRLTEDSHAFYMELIYRDCGGRTVLEYGCGGGSQSFGLAKRNDAVIGIDISPVAVETAAAKASSEGLSGLSFAVMDAERTTFADATFDLVTGSGILHHLELQRAYAEIARVLKPGGRAVFAEPLGHNPAINWFRRRTPGLRTPDEHPLLVSDLRFAEHYFERVSVHYFHLATLGAMAFVRTPLFRPVRLALSSLDRALFATLPAARRYAWICVLEFSKQASPAAA